MNLFFKITKEKNKIDIEELFKALENLKKNKTGALIVFERNSNLDFVKADGDTLNANISASLIESIFFKNSPLHDGALIIEGNSMTSSRVTLPLSKKKLNKSYGLRHKAGVGITEDTDAISIVVSEETGKISYIKNGEFIDFKNNEQLRDILLDDLAN